MVLSNTLKLKDEVDEEIENIVKSRVLRKFSYPFDHLYPQRMPNSQIPFGENVLKEKLFEY